MKRHHNAKFDIHTELDICRLYVIGVDNSTKAIAKRYGCSYGAIINILKHHGVNIRSNSSSQTGLRTGKKGNHPTYKGGNISPDGYRRIIVDRKLVLEHRHIMEEHLGRKLKKSEIVHHINGDKLDNAMSNLEITNREDHAKHHDLDRERAYNGRYI